MKLSEIYKVADSLAPKCLSDEVCQKYGAYDNSGILVDCGKENLKITEPVDLYFAQAVLKMRRECAKK